MNTLTAISPIDGRYRQKTIDLSHYFSEFALIGYRIMVEVEYFIALCKLPLPQLDGVTEEHFEQLRSVYETFDIEQAEEIKATEKITNHDVKAVEYFIKNHLETIGLADFKEFVHFGLTSQDINNTAVPLLLRDAFHEQYLPTIEKIIDQNSRQMEHLSLVRRNVFWASSDEVCELHEHCSIFFYCSFNTKRTIIAMEGFIP